MGIAEFNSWTLKLLWKLRSEWRSYKISELEKMKTISASYQVSCLNDKLSLKAPCTGAWMHETSALERVTEFKSKSDSEHLDISVLLCTEKDCQGRL
ncbi:hypothetical protein SLA2020_366000 [Shorea laevis]